MPSGVVRGYDARTGTKLWSWEPLQAPKDARNTCTFFEPRTTVERETKSATSPAGQSSAKKAFDDLFK